MLYYIVPPIIIVISSAILIVFLFKKFSKGENIDPRVLENLNGGSSEVNLGGKITSFISHLWLRILEKMMQRTKLFSLKMHNVSNDWFHSIKNKREKSGQVLINIENAESEKEAVEEKVPRREVDEIIKPSRLGEVGRGFFRAKSSSMERFSAMKDKLSNKGNMFLKKEDLKEKEVVEKGEMEEALIKRIAVNPKDIEAYERLGDYYSDMKSFRDSIECYKQVLRLSPDHGKARVKIKNLEILLKK